MLKQLEAIHTRLKEPLKDLADEMAKDTADRSDEVIGRTLTAMTEIVKAEEEAGYGGTAELAQQIEDLRKKLDLESEARIKLEKMGLAVKDRGVELLGRREIMDLRRVGRVFRYKEDAERFGALVARSAWGKTKVYEDVVAKRTRDLADELVKQLDPGVTGAGAELVANLFMADLLVQVEAVGTLFVLCDRVPLQTIGQTTWPKLTGELTAHPLAASATIPETAPTFETVAMTPIKWGVFTPIPNEFFRNPTLLDALGQRVGWLITRAIPYAADNALVNGDGTADYGNITGLLQDANITAIVPAAAATIAAYTGAEVGAVVAGITSDYVTDMRWMFSLSSERTWRNVRDTLGHPLYERGGNAEPNTVDGFPYTVCQRFPAAGSVSASTKWGAFGNLRLSHFFGMLGAIEIAQSEHVRFQQDVTCLRGIAYFDAALKDANAVVTMKTHA